MLEIGKNMAFGVLFLFLLGILQVINGTYLIASFDQNDIRGYVRFTEDASENVTVKVNLTLSTFVDVSWKIKLYPAIYPKCQQTGNFFYNLNDSLGYISNAQYKNVNLSLSGSSSILGHTLVLYHKNTSILACASILPPPNATMYAKAVISNSMIAGSFEFLQNGDKDTMIFGQVSLSDGSNSSSLGHGWAIFSTNMMNSDCSGTVFNPTNQSGICTKKQESTCPVGGLTAKFGSLTVGTAGSSIFHGVDGSLSLHGDNNVMSRMLVVYQKGSMEKLGCGMIHKAGPLSVQSKFTSSIHEGISGTISFLQHSPYHQTKLDVSLKGLGKRAGGYHVHVFPISSLSKPCAPASAGGHLNPYGIIPKNSPKPNKGSVDKYEIGDLSGKFGFLADKDVYQLSVMDSNLPLYGFDTSFGRSLVIHRDDNTSSRFVCSDIVVENPKGYLSSVVNYTKNSASVLDGVVTLRQYIQANNVFTPTAIVANLHYRSNSSKKTYQHNFHVHISPISSKETGVCASALGHYNPTNVNVKANYPSQCSRHHPYRCEVGDTSAKVGQYNIGNGKAFYTDVDTPMFGHHSVLGRSLVFHHENKGAPRLACADTVPDPASDVVKISFSVNNKTIMYKFHLMKTMLSKILFGSKASLKSWRISYLTMSVSSENEDCIDATVSVLDKNGEHMKDVMKKAMDSRQPSHVKEFTEKCEKKKAPSSAIVVSSSQWLTVVFFIVTLLS